MVQRTGSFGKSITTKSPLSAQSPVLPALAQDFQCFPFLPPLGGWWEKEVTMYFHVSFSKREKMRTKEKRRGRSLTLLCLQLRLPWPQRQNPIQLGCKDKRWPIKGLFILTHLRALVKGNRGPCTAAGDGVWKCGPGYSEYEDELFHKEVSFCKTHVFLQRKMVKKVTALSGLSKNILIFTVG